MTTVGEVLASRGCNLPDERLAEALQVLLPGQPPGSADLTDAEQAFLDANGGAPKATTADVERMRVHTGAMALAEAVMSFTRQEVADRLGIEPDAVMNLAEGGRLFRYQRDGGDAFFPDWQIHEDRVLPDLAEVLAAIPMGSHPLAVRSFMDDVEEDLVVDGWPVSPRQWMITGGDPAVLLPLASTLGEQI